jgi:Holliday junction resolvase
MGAMQRRKGASSERAICTLDREYGFTSIRTAPMQASGNADQFADVSCGQYPLSLLNREVKAYRRVPLTTFVTKYLVQMDAAPGTVNALVTKSNGEPWMLTMPYEEFLKMMRAWADARSELASKEDDHGDYPITGD